MSSLICVRISKYFDSSFYVYDYKRNLGGIVALKGKSDVDGIADILGAQRQETRPE
jgi:hypothetical protein